MTILKQKNKLNMLIKSAILCLYFSSTLLLFLNCNNGTSESDLKIESIDHFFPTRINGIFSVNEHWFVTANKGNIYEKYPEESYWRIQILSDDYPRLPSDSSKRNDLGPTRFAPNIKKVVGAESSHESTYLAAGTLSFIRVDSDSQSGNWVSLYPHLVGMKDAVYANELFVAVGASTKKFAASGNIYYNHSPKEEPWTSLSIDQPDRTTETSPRRTVFKKIVAAPISGITKFVTIANKGIIAVGSRDGEAFSMTWKMIDSFFDSNDIPVSSLRPDLNDVIYAANRFIVVGSHGTILTSQDGETWKIIALEKSLNLGKIEFNAISYGSSKFVIVGEEGTILNSTDGINWSSVSSIDTRQSIKELAFTNNLFVAVGSYYSNSEFSEDKSGLILESNNGFDWGISSSPFNDQIPQQIDSLGDSFYIFANLHKFYRSPSYPSLIWTQERDILENPERDLYDHRHGDISPRILFPVAIPDK